jgi:hypothetical protein
MQFLLTAWDGTDERALDRRMAARPAHLANAEHLQAAGRLCFAAAILDEAGRMIGTSAIYEVASRGELDALLETEPYVTGGVWKRIEIHPCRVGPAFQRSV